MSRIEWTRLSGDEVEELVAILVSRRHPNSIRVRPSRGDGGIDLLLPQQDGSFNVLQVKKFAENLTTSQKNQISNSLDRLRVYAEERSLRITKWDLVTPLDPTNENREWLAKLPPVQGTSSGWLGRNFVDGLAAQFPDVIDYYVDGGRQRLQDALAGLTDLLRRQSGLGGDGPLRAVDAESLLRSLSAQIDSADPHYSYDLHITTEQLDTETINPKLLVAVWQSGVPGAWVTIAVRARFADAPNVRPIEGTLNVRVPRGSELESALQDFNDYGADLVLSKDNFDFTADLPGGLFPGSLGPEAVLQIRANPIPGGAPQEVRCTITAPDGNPLADTIVVLQSSAPGLTGVGGRTDGTEIGGVFDLTVYANISTQQVRLNVSSRDLQGKRLEDVHAGVQFLAHFGAPNRLALHNPYQPPPASRSHLIEQPMDPGAGVLQTVIEALLEIQRGAGRTIRVPDLLNTPVEQFTPWIMAAGLLRGETYAVPWTEMNATSPDGPPIDAQEVESRFPGAIAIRSPLTVTVAGTELHLGTQQFWAPAVQLKTLPVDPGTAATSLVLEPADESPAIISLVNVEAD